MDQGLGAQVPHQIWISQTECIISFHPIEGSEYEMLEFSSHEAKMEFVLQKSSNGFRIQQVGIYTKRKKQ